MSFLPPTSCSNLHQAPLRPALQPIPATQPYIGLRLSCGFPNPSEDFSEGRLDLNSLMVQNTQATFYFRVQGNSMADIGLVEGSYVVVDRSIQARSGHVVVAIVNHEYIVKRLLLENGRCELHSENEDYPPIKFAEHDELAIWGVVTGWAHRLTY